MKQLFRACIKKLTSVRWAYFVVAIMQIVAVLASSGIATADSTTCTDPTACQSTTGICTDPTADPIANNCLNGDDLYSINTNGPNYNPLDTACGSASGATATDASLSTSSGAIVPPGQGTGTWVSGLQPPYILEQFMIELLKDIAKKRGVPTSDAVTQQHVIALIAFAWGEGGDLTNDNFWNPFNTGLKADDLTVPGKQSSNGSTEVFKSFDAGVEATARVMTGDTQGRLGVTLTDPNSTATDFINSLLDFSPLSQGHYPWAEASDPSSRYYEPNYKQVRLDLISQVTSSYDSMASTVMRGQASDPKNQHNTSKLTFHTNGSNSTTIVDASLNTTCGTDTGLSSTGGGSFSQKVRAYVWPTYHEGPYCLMMPAYATAIQSAIKNGEYVGGGFGGVYKSAQVDSSSVPIAAADNCTASGDREGIDCGGFVTRVYRDSGADPHYNQGNGPVPTQHDYVASHPTLYQRVYPKQSTNLKRGDIYFEQGDGHTYLYVGEHFFVDPKNPKIDYNSVSASVSYSRYGQSWRTPMASTADDIQGGIWYHPLFPIDNLAV